MSRLASRLRMRRGRKVTHRFDASFGEWRIKGRELRRRGTRQPISGSSAHICREAALPAGPAESRSPDGSDGGGERSDRVRVVVQLPNGQQESSAAPPGEETRARVFVQLINQASHYFAALEAADPAFRERSPIQTVCARARMPLLGVGVAVLIVGVWTVSPLYWSGLFLLAVGLTCYFRLGVHGGEAVMMRPPVRGRWIAINSPADRVPSHHLTAYGQGQAVDLVHDTDSRPDMGWWPLARRPQAFPGYGQPILSPVDGVVIRVVSKRRDHWSRTSWPALLYLLVESVREFLGPSHVLGNHVVIKCGARRYAVLAHLRRRSARVREGQRVLAGQQLAECGNSGNSTEPHVHVQVMDHPNPLFAAGLPIVFGTGDDSGWMPRANEVLHRK
jgi:hypothetical protein